MTIVATAGAANADSYVTLTEANDYFTALGVTAWTGTDSVKEVALRKGTAYLDNQYRGLWRGITFTSTQALAWPRAEGTREPYRMSLLSPLYDAEGRSIATDSVPAQVKRAAMEAALLALGGTDLEPALDRGGQIKSISKGVGPLSKSITYMDGAPSVTQYTKIEGMLRGLVTSTPGATSGNVRLVRA